MGLYLLDCDLPEAQRHYAEWRASKPLLLSAKNRSDAPAKAHTHCVAPIRSTISFPYDIYVLPFFSMSLALFQFVSLINIQFIFGLFLPIIL
jgi:hypothetical protein